MILKQVKNINVSQIPAFMLEVKIGSLNKTKNFGPEIIAHRIYQQSNGRYTGEFIMENIFKLFPNLETMTLDKYLTEYFPNSAPPRESNLYKKLADTLFNFYKASESYHGDMHGQNIYVILDPITKKVKHIKLIDYGSTFPIRNKNRLKSLRSLSNILKQINEQHNRNVRRREQATRTTLPNWPTGSGAKYFVPNGYLNSVRSNLNIMGRVWNIKNKPAALRRLENAFKNKVNTVQPPVPPPVTPAQNSELPPPPRNHLRNIPRNNASNGNIMRWLGITYTTESNFRKNIRKAQLKYHPNKNPGRQNEARKAFNLVQKLANMPEREAARRQREANNAARRQQAANIARRQREANNAVRRQQAANIARRQQAANMARRQQAANMTRRQQEARRFRNNINRTFAPDMFRRPFVRPPPIVTMPPPPPPPLVTQRELVSERAYVTNMYNRAKNLGNLNKIKSNLQELSKTLPVYKILLKEHNFRAQNRYRNIVRNSNAGKKLMKN
jgi:flagellar biosynthesis GTPase FlhF